MNKPLQPPVTPDDDIGALDENGQQIWSSEEEEASVRMWADPEFMAGLAEAEADIAAGRLFSSEEVEAYMAEVRRRWLQERGLG